MTIAVGAEWSGRVVDVEGTEVALEPDPLVDLGDTASTARRFDTSTPETKRWQLSRQSPRPPAGRAHPRSRRLADGAPDGAPGARLVLDQQPGLSGRLLERAGERRKRPFEPGVESRPEV